MFSGSVLSRILLFINFACKEHFLDIRMNGGLLLFILFYNKFNKIKFSKVPW